MAKNCLLKPMKRSASFRPQMLRYTCISSDAPLVGLMFHLTCDCQTLPVCITSLTHSFLYHTSSLLSFLIFHRSQGLSGSIWSIYVTTSSKTTSNCEQKEFRQTFSTTIYCKKCFVLPQSLLMHIFSASCFRHLKCCLGILKWFQGAMEILCIHRSNQFKKSNFGQILASRKHTSHSCALNLCSP